MFANENKFRLKPGFVAEFLPCLLQGTRCQYSPCNRRGRNSATIPPRSEACHNGGQPLSAEACALCTHSCSWWLRTRRPAFRHRSDKCRTARPPACETIGLADSVERSSAGPCFSPGRKLGAGRHHSSSHSSSSLIIITHLTDFDKLRVPPATDGRGTQPQRSPV